jgi:hypothetical protein
MGNKFNDQIVHAAMLLAYSESIYGVIRADLNCIPSTLYRITYDEENNNISMEETHGYSLPPEEGAMDLSVIDNIFCSNIRGLPLLLEGETGTGKTYPAMKFLSTILQKEQFFSYRLSASAFMNNLFSHFQEGKVDKGGMPVITARTDKIEACGAGILDEINRSDSNESLQFFDHEMHLGGVIYKIGLPIPDISTGKYNPRTGRLKEMTIICAQNPAEDAKFTQTMQLDAAVDNRLLKTNVGNAASSAGSTLWLTDSKKNPHDLFLRDFIRRTCQYLNLDLSVFKDIKQDWLSIYAWITESARTDKPAVYSSLELADLMIATFNRDLIKYYDYERDVIKKLDDVLKKDIIIKNPLKETDQVKKIHEIVRSFKVPIIFRDIVQIGKVADVLSTLRNIKDAVRSDNPVRTYLIARKYITARDVAGATVLVGRNKQMKGATPPTKVVNAALARYVGLVEEYMKDSNALSQKFELLDSNASIKKSAVYKSLKETVGKGGIDYLINRISKQAKHLTKKISASQDIKNILIARSVGDLMTLCSFLRDYKTELNPLFKKYNKQTQLTRIVEYLGTFYKKKLKQKAMVFPEIYQHRILRTLGFV